MEKAVMVDNLSKLTDESSRYQRLYYGQEFCPQTFLTLKELQSVILFCEKKHIKLTLVTPYMTDESMDVMGHLIKEAYEEPVWDELVINDFGMLYFIHNNYPGRFKLIWGRLLNKTKKSPSILNYYAKLDDESKEALQTTAGEFFPNLAFMRKYQIAGIQFENKLQGNLSAKEDNSDFNIPKLARELVYPYVHITTSRRCFSSILYGKTPMSMWKTSTLCNKSCKTCKAVLYNEVMKKDILLKGNSLYYENTDLPANLPEYSRIITQIL
ncbi:hypothetical protein V3851_12385 [Paenibacillus sp. M1]|uniref:Uncharacterized protein n=1 Tax=Paenibacillus haidiansis TaxID=1574488 RepID=A0ABU7VUM4_9BACL